MADRETVQGQTRRKLPPKTPRRLVGAAFFVCCGIASVRAADPVCGPHLESIEIPAEMHLGNDIPFFGENITQEATRTVRKGARPACGRIDLHFREVAFEDSFEELRAAYLEWLETRLTGPNPLASPYVRNHGVKIVDRPGEFRYIDAVKAEPDHEGRLEIHLSEERGANGRNCRQVILHYSYRGESCDSSAP